MNTKKASEGKWLFNVETFAKEVSSFGDLSHWSEVSEDEKVQWELEHPIEDENTD